MPAPSLPERDTHWLIAALRAAVGPAQVLTDPADTQPFRTGIRFGEGQVAAVASPLDLVSLWRALRAATEAGAIIIMQAANTGLTGGSTPAGDDYDRPVVLISTLAIDRIHILQDGRQVICLPGATLYDLEARLKPFGREPHSVIGSSCIGASVIGGICNNSGGSLIHRGPAYTELALFAQLDACHRLHLVNHLGIRLSGEPEEILARVERGDFPEADILPNTGQASDTGYRQRVREIDADTPARFNADPDRLFEASGCAGRVAVMAVRLDSFPAHAGASTFYIGTNDPDELMTLRRSMLRSFEHLPIAAEYLHRDCFNIAERYGKDTYLAIRLLGTDRLPALYRLKHRVDRAFRWFGAAFSDRVLQMVSNCLPSHLPARLRSYRDRFEHHLILKVPREGVAEAEQHLGTLFPSPSGDFFHCTDQEGESAFLHRFAAAGAATRYRDIHPDEVEDILALDIALRRNDEDWFEKLPPEIEDELVHKLYYGHFFCHVFHQDYIVRKGADPSSLKQAMLANLDRRGARYPAEHNVGHMYPASPALADFYKRLDPCNAFNPGIGQTSKRAAWRS